MKKLVPRSVSQLWISANFLKNQHVFLDTGIHFLKSLTSRIVSQLFEKSRCFS